MENSNLASVCEDKSRIKINVSEVTTILTSFPLIVNNKKLKSPTLILPKYEYLTRIGTACTRMSTSIKQNTPRTKIKITYNLSIFLKWSYYYSGIIITGIHSSVISLGFLVLLKTSRNLTLISKPTPIYYFDVIERWSSHLVSPLWVGQIVPMKPTRKQHYTVHNRSF